MNTNMMEQEIEQDRQLDKMDDTSGEINPYKELIVYNADKIEPLNDADGTVVNLE